jgi:U3 small nucleolar RNA-associated protein 20
VLTVNDLLSDAAEVVDELPDLEVEEANQSVEAATRIHFIIAQQLLPQKKNKNKIKNKILTARPKRDTQHKSVMDHFPEDDEILWVPIALALVHLLKNLPSTTLERNLPG